MAPGGAERFPEKHRAIREFAGAGLILAIFFRGFCSQKPAALFAGTVSAPKDYRKPLLESELR